jgi:hypothetical protein
MTWFSLGLQIQADLPAALELALQRSWQTPAPAAPVDARTLYIRVGSRPAPPPHGLWQDVSFEGTSWSVCVDRHQLWVENSAYLHWTLDGPCIHMRDPQDVTLPWVLLMTEAHRAAGWVPLHATVIDRPGGAVAVLGHSGAGKSTLALRSLQAGLQVLAEDRAWWCAETGVVVGLDRTLRVFEDSLLRFAPALADAAGTFARDRHGKRCVPLPEGTFRPLDEVVLLGAPEELSVYRKIAALWEAVGVPLLAQGRQVTQQALPVLLTLMPDHALSRDQAFIRGQAGTERAAGTADGSAARRTRQEGHQGLPPKRDSAPPH